MLVTMPISIKLFMLQPVIYFIERFHVHAVVDIVLLFHLKCKVLLRWFFSSSFIYLSFSLVADKNKRVKVTIKHNNK